MSMYGGMPVKAPVKHWMIDLRSKKDHCDSFSLNSNIYKVFFKLINPITTLEMLLTMTNLAQIPMLQSLYMETLYGNTPMEGLLGLKQSHSPISNHLDLRSTRQYEETELWPEKFE